MIQFLWLLSNSGQFTSASAWEPICSLLVMEIGPIP